MSDKLFVWDGNRENLPPPWEKFIYKDGQYLITIVDGEVHVHNIEKESFDLGLEVRIYGEKSNISLANILIKTGVASVEEVADAFEKQEGKELLKMTEKLAALVRKEGGTTPMKFLQSKGVTTAEIAEFGEMLDTLTAEILVGSLLGKLL